MLWWCQTKSLTIASFGHFVILIFEMYLYIEALSLRAYIRLTRQDLSVFKMTCCLAMPVICLFVDAHPASECVPPQLIKVEAHEMEWDNEV